MRPAFIVLALSAFAVAKPLRAVTHASDSSALVDNIDEVAFAKDVDTMVEQAWQANADFGDKHKHKHKHLRKLINRIVKKAVAVEVASALNQAFAKLKAAGVLTGPVPAILVEAPAITHHAEAKDADDEVHASVETTGPVVAATPSVITAVVAAATPVVSSTTTAAASVAPSSTNKV